MAIIKLDTRKNDRQWRVVADTLGQVGGPPTHLKGNVDLLAGSAVTWTTDNSPGWLTHYEVTFKDLSSGNPTWPFMQKGDSNDPAPAGYLGPLVVNRGSSVAKTVAAGAAPLVMYDVKAFRKKSDDPEVDSLDPMMIIRPTSGSPSTSSNWVPIAVVSAVLGATAAALLTAAMLS